MAHCNSIDGVSLVVLAAGLGSRFGGWKQLANVGATGRPLMCRSAEDAWNAGVRSVVLVVNKAIERAIEEQILPLLPVEMEVSLVRQDPDDLPAACSVPARDKPWGTGHALWCARNAVSGDCIVINADDYYGPNSMRLLLRHFARRRNWAMVSFRLSDTLSESGAVNRGLCEVRGGILCSVRECLGIIRDDRGLHGEMDGRTVSLSSDVPVSMNIWGFTADVFDCLERGLIRFFNAGEPEESAEFYLPSLVMESIAAGEGSVSVYPGSDRWRGVTYPEDLRRLDEEPGTHA